MPFLVILQKNELIFNNQELKMYSLDGKRLMTKMRNIPLSKNKDSLKVYEFVFRVRKRYYFPVPLIIHFKTKIWTVNTVQLITIFSA